MWKLKICRHHMIRCHTLRIHLQLWVTKLRPKCKRRQSRLGIRAGVIGRKEAVIRRRLIAPIRPTLNIFWILNVSFNKANKVAGLPLSLSVASAVGLIKQNLLYRISRGARNFYDKKSTRTTACAFVKSVRSNHAEATRPPMQEIMDPLAYAKSNGLAFLTGWYERSNIHIC